MHGLDKWNTPKSHENCRPYIVWFTVALNGVRTKPLLFVVGVTSLQVFKPLNWVSRVGTLIGTVTKPLYLFVTTQNQNGTMGERHCC